MTTPDITPLPQEARLVFAEFEHKEQEAVYAAIGAWALRLQTEPPEGLWTPMLFHPGSERKTRIPYVQQEADAIAAAMGAAEELMHLAASGSGAARKWILATPLYPRIEKSATLPRRAFVGELIDGARIAYATVAEYKHTAWEPRGDRAALFDTLIELPDHLQQHTERV